MREKGGKERKNKKEKEKDEVCMRERERERERESCSYVKFYQVDPTLFKIFIKVSSSNVI